MSFASQQVVPVVSRGRILSASYSESGFTAEWVARATNWVRFVILRSNGNPLDLDLDG